MLQTLKNKAVALSLPLVLMGSSLAYADESTNTISLDSIIQTGNLRSAISEKLTEWVSMGFGIGVSLLVVWLGYRLLRRFLK